MSNYYILLAEQHRADLIASAGYRVIAPAKREVSRESIAHYVHQQEHAERESTRASRRTAIASFADAFKGLFRSRTLTAR